MRRTGPLLVLVAALAGCGSSSTLPATGLVVRSPALPPPLAVDHGVRGAAYLTAIGQHLQPRWSQFLEDCRLRLPPAHALNAMTLAARADLAIDRNGRVTAIKIATSGSADFDLAVRDVLAEVPRVDPPAIELLSDDDQVHLQWLFARDRRQAGPSTAQVLMIELPLEAVVTRLVAQNELTRAARRVAASPAQHPEREAAAERVMIAALREALGSTGAAARKTAVEAIGRAKVRVLAPQVRAFLSPTVDTELRLAAIVAAGRLQDDGAIELLASQLPSDLPNYPRLALAETTALIELGRRERAATVIRRMIEADPKAPMISALHAHALAPTPELAPKLVTWFARGDARTRAAVCSAVPADAAQTTVIARGLRDPDATVRGICADAAARLGKHADATILRRTRDLIRDRDRLVRARAVAALAILDPRARIRAATDPAPEVRRAAVAAASELELRTLASDPDPDVRAAALETLGDRAGELAQRAVTDVAPQVRRAAIASVTDEDVLTRLASDDSPEVATDALVKLTTRRGRSAMATALTTQLGAAPAGSAERVRIALAYLLGR